MATPSIIPAINAQTQEEVEGYIRTASEFTHFFHLDIVDGKFVPHTTWGTPKELRALLDKNHWKDFEFEIHLMVENPESQILAWSGAGAKRVIVHAEAVENRESVLDQSARKTPTIMVAINPESPTSLLEPYLNTVEFFQILAVTPGKAGQKFNPTVINKISELREKALRVTIEVDGGINPKTARMCRYAGANIFVAASHIFKNSNPKKAFDELVQSIDV
jgi:ribulose-phosphate 3-epimerase